MGAEIIRFPVAERMPTRVAEEKLGNFLQYRYPPFPKGHADLWEWLDTWLRAKRVVTGWSVVNKGLAHAFKMGRVGHSIVDVYPVDVDVGERPRIELACAFSSYYSVFNWESKDRVKGLSPAIILSPDQDPYFRPCKVCEKHLSKRAR